MNTLRRPAIVTGLSVFFTLGAAVSGLSLLALLWPGGLLEPVWRLNPRARDQFATMGGRGPVLLAVVCVQCAAAAVGTFKGARFGFVLALTLLVVSLFGDLFNALSGLEPRAWLGVPVALLLLAALASRRSRAYFERPSGSTQGRR